MNVQWVRQSQRRKAKIHLLQRWSLEEEPCHHWRAADTRPCALSVLRAGDPRLDTGRSFPPSEFQSSVKRKTNMYFQQTEKLCMINMFKIVNPEQETPAAYLQRKDPQNGKKKKKKKTSPTSGCQGALTWKMASCSTSLVRILFVGFRNVLPF